MSLRVGPKKGLRIFLKCAGGFLLLALALAFAGCPMDQIFGSIHASVDEGESQASLSVTVTVSPATVTVTRGNTQHFTAEVKDPEGNVLTGPDGKVEWAIQGNTPDHAGIGANGSLTVNRAETAGALTVLARSLKNPAGVGRAAVTLSDKVFALTPALNALSPTYTYIQKSKATPIAVSLTNQADIEGQWGAVSGDGNNSLTYQWYSSAAPSNSGGMEISGETGPSYTPPTTAMGKSYFYVVVTNTIKDNKDGGTKAAAAHSGIVTVTVTPHPDYSIRLSGGQYTGGSNGYLSDGDKIYTFPALGEGFVSTDVNPLYVTITNTGNQPTGELRIKISGSDIYFLLNDSLEDYNFDYPRTYYYITIPSIDQGESVAFPVRPYSSSGIVAGTPYTATITVGPNADSPGPNTPAAVNFNVEFTVNAAQYYYEMSWNPAVGKVESARRTVTAYTLISPDSDSNNYIHEGWYVVSDTDSDLYATVGIGANSTANIILLDNTNLKINGSDMGDGATLNIYAQKDAAWYATDNHTGSATINGSVGKLTATASLISYPGIGTNNVSSKPLITIHGGEIAANGNNACGIGIGSGSFLVYGGTVTATGHGGNASGIGGRTEVNDNTQRIAIYGGMVIAQGDQGGAGIGADTDNFNCPITYIYGGTVQATGGAGANVSGVDGSENGNPGQGGGAGIGTGGKQSSVNNTAQIFIYGGVVRSTGGVGGNGASAGNNGGPGGGGGAGIGTGGAGAGNTSTNNGIIITRLPGTFIGTAPTPPNITVTGGAGGNGGTGITPGVGGGGGAGVGTGGSGSSNGGSSGTITIGDGATITGTGIQGGAGGTGAGGGAGVGTGGVGSGTSGSAGSITVGGSTGNDGGTYSSRIFAGTGGSADKVGKGGGGGP